MPRYWSYELGFEWTCSRLLPVAPRMTRVVGLAPSCRIVPLGALTRMRQVVLEPADVVVVVGVTRSLASIGKVFETPSIVQAVARP